MTLFPRGLFPFRPLGLSFSAFVCLRSRSEALNAAGHGTGIQKSHCASQAAAHFINDGGTHALRM